MWNNLDITWALFLANPLLWLLQLLIPDFYFVIFNLSNEWKQCIGSVSVQMPWKSLGVLAKLRWDTNAVHVSALLWACSHYLRTRTPCCCHNIHLAVIHLPSCSALLLSLTTLGFNTLGTAGWAADLPANCLSPGQEQRQKQRAAQWDLLALWHRNRRWGPKDWCHAQNIGP